LVTMFRHIDFGAIGVTRMGIAQDNLMTVKAQLSAQIEQLSERAPRLSASEIAAQVDLIRRSARDQGLPALADISHGLESALARSDSLVMIRSWLETMQEAVGCDPFDQSMSQALLASIGRRLYG
jgi:hypothetical protein